MNKNNIIYLSEDATSAQYRYRVKNILEALKDNKKYNLASFLKSDISKLEKELPRADLIILERQTAKNSVIPNLIDRAKSFGVKVIFDLDDLIFDYRDLPTLMRATNSKNIFYWVGYFWGIRRVAKHADGFIVTNGFLAKKIKRSFKKPVAIIPNSLNAEQIKISQDACKKKQNNKTYTLGYFSGSPTHAKDFRIIEPAITKFLEVHRNASLTVVGYMDFSAQAKQLIDKGRIKFEKPVDYLRLQEKIANVDINLAPLAINDFTNCKSELKFFEAAIVKTPTIASPSYSFKHAIKNKETGLLAEPDEWYAQLEYAYSHPKEMSAIALSAKEYALENYYGDKLVKDIEAAYGIFI
ncbi:glycosyltransferase [Candidatus Saccharibacteria bacterium]|nr:glycosyltransferase [Candidatus Saccharibacteria bacterium]